MPDRSAVPPPKPESKYKPIVITIVCAIVLGAGSCWGFATTMGSNGDFTMLFALVFLACVAAFFGGLIWLFVTFLMNINRR